MRITHICGHDAEHKWADSPYDLRDYGGKMEDKPCPDCYAAKR